MPAVNPSAGWAFCMKEKEKQIRKELMNCRSKKVRLRIIQLLKLMNFFGRDLRVQQAVDYSYYTQKQQEIETLEERLNESVEKAIDYMNKLENCCNDVSVRWRRDFVSLRRVIGRTVDVNQKNLT